MEWSLNGSEPLTLAMLQRVNVVGCSGGGKSTVARHLATLLGHAYVEMDQVFWKPNWRESDVEVFRGRIRTLLDTPRWVLDGNYHSKTRDLKWARATLVVWVDRPLGRTLWQITKRSLARAWDKRELWPGTGNRESFRRLLSHDSMVLWTLHSHGRLRKRYAASMADPGNAQLSFVRLRCDADLEAFEAHCRAALARG